MFNSEVSSQLRFETENKKWRDEAIETNDESNALKQFTYQQPKTIDHSQKMNVLYNPEQDLYKSPGQHNIFSKPDAQSEDKEDVALGLGEVAEQPTNKKANHASSRMQAYGTSNTEGERYQTGDVDFVTTSQGDMTMISGKGLNITGIHKRVKTGSSRAS